MKKSLWLAALVGLLPMGMLASCGDDPAPEVEKATIQLSGATSVNMGESTTLTATVTNAADYRLDWSSSDITVATIASNGSLTTYKVTEDKVVTITCKIRGTDISTSLDITVKYVAPVAKPTIKVTGASTVNMGETTTLTATVKNLNEYNVLWSSSNENFATVLDGVVTAKEVTKDEQVTITAKIEGREDIKVDYVLTIKYVDNTPAPTISITGPKAVKMGASITLTATVANLDAYTLVWSSSNTEIATVAEGVVTAKTVTKDEEVTITAKIEGQEDVKFDYVVKVEYVAPDPTFVVNGESSVLMEKTLTLTPVVEHLENPVITWETSNADVATVANGVVTTKAVKADTKVTITAKIAGHPELTVEKVITVKYVAPQGTKVFCAQLYKNANFVKYASNSGVQKNKQEEFIQKNKVQVAGDDNAISFKPANIDFMNIDGDPVPFTGEWKYVIELSEKTGENTYEPVALSSTNLIDSIDYKECLVDFSDKAIGKQFKVRVISDYLTENQKNDPEFETYYALNYEIKVADGYNVYETKDLAYFDNRKLYRGSSKNDEIQGWEDYKIAHGMDVDYHPSSFIFQTDIKITIDDIPDVFYWDASDTDFPKDAAEGARINKSMRDDVTVYEHTLAENETMNFEGNYFTIDSSAIQGILYDNNKKTEKGGLIVSETELFWARSSNFDTVPGGAKPANAKSGYVNITNVKSLGNAAREENNENGGGFIFFKTASSESKVENCIARSYFISYFQDYSAKTKYIVRDSKGYDSYSNFIYLWAVNDALIENCEFIGAGGPCIIADDKTEGSDIHNPSNITLRNNNIQCYVTGSEGWFKGYKADAIAVQVKDLNGNFVPFGRTFLRTREGGDATTFFNFICLHKSGEAQAMTTKLLHGSIQVNDETRFELGDGKTDPVFTTLYAGATTGDGLAGAVKGAPIFKSSAGGYGFFNVNPNPGLYPFTASGVGNQITNPQDSIFQGNYLGLYYSGMLLTFGYYAAGSTF